MPPIPAKSPSRERLLDTILQSAIEYAIISMDLDGCVTTWNEGARRILGWEESEMIGQPADVIFTPQDRQAGVPAQEMQAALTTGHGNDERWHNRRDQSLFWASGQIMVLRNDEGAAEGFVKILRDRTDQREQADRQQVLMHELSHRMKNTLTVVQAITSQSFRYATTLEDAATIISARISAYSKAHEILLQQNWLGADLKTIVDATASNLGIDAPGRFISDGQAVELGPQAALAFALVLHELATNASKYGALSCPAGRVELNWSVTPRDGTDCLSFRWQELGGPAVSPPQQKGFGSRLISSSLGAFGDLTLDYHAGGLMLHLDAPLQKLQYKSILHPQA